MPVESLLVAIVQPDDADAAIAALNRAGLRVTRVSSTGGFLGAGNVTLMSGMKRAQVELAIALLSEHCRARTALINASPAIAGADGYAAIAPIEATVSGATIFVLPVERYARFEEGNESVECAQRASQAGQVKLVTAIVPAEEAHALLDELSAANCRATLVSTTGGFLRRGNATLLIGVGAGQADDLLTLIREFCTAVPRARESCATIFVMDVERFERV